VTAKRKTPKQIVDDCNALARKFYAPLGYDVPKGYRFDQANHPQERSVWRQACTAYEHIEGHNPEDAVCELEDE